MNTINEMIHRVYSDSEVATATRILRRFSDTPRWKLAFGKIVDEAGEVICVLPRRESNDTAYLIAAAPELLAALQDLVGEADLGEVDLESEEYQKLERARAAIAKAEGRA